MASCLSWSRPAGGRPSRQRLEPGPGKKNKSQSSTSRRGRSRSTVATEPGPFGVDLLPDGRTAYLRQQRHERGPHRRRRRGTIKKKISVGAGPQAVAVGPGGKIVYVATHGSDEVTSDRREGGGPSPAASTRGSAADGAVRARRRGRFFRHRRGPPDGHGRRRRRRARSRSSSSSRDCLAHRRRRRPALQSAVFSPDGKHHLRHHGRRPNPRPLIGRSRQEGARQRDRRGRGFREASRSARTERSSTPRTGLRRRRDHRHRVQEGGGPRRRCPARRRECSRPLKSGETVILEVLMSAIVLASAVPPDILARIRAYMESGPFISGKVTAVGRARPSRTTSCSGLIRREPRRRPSCSWAC